jgi:RNA methyltransferase, TrmH family
VSRIDSPANPRVKEALRAVRDGELVPIEGTRAIGEALADGLRPVAVFHEEEALDGPLREALAGRGAELIVCSERVVARLSDLPSARRAVALVPPRDLRLPDLPFPSGSLALLLDSVQDPSNVGAILRSAEAFGAAAAVLTKGSANPFSTKALRASAGSAFRVPLATGVDAPDAIAWARKADAAVVGAEARGGVEPGDVDPTRRLLLVIGSEGHGLSAGVAGSLDLRVTIPLRGRVESLNAAVAAALLLYALSPKTSASNR